MDIIVDWDLVWELLPSMISTIITLIIIFGFVWIVLWFVPHNYLGCWEYPIPKTKSGIKKIKSFVKGFMGNSPSNINNLKRKTLRKKFNIIKYNFRHNDEYSPFPLTAKIEINGTCNLDCIMCLRKSLANRDKIMSYPNFQKVLDNLPTIIEWSPHGYNEPMLHPLFFNFIKETNNRKIELTLVSNGTILNQTNVDTLVKLKPNLIRISVDAVEKRYEEIRKNSSWEKVLRNIKYLSTKTNNFSLYATIWKENIDQIPNLIELSTELNCKISFTDITWKNDFQESILENSIRENISEKKIIEIKEKYLDHGNIHFSIGKNKKRSCTLPWSSVYIDVIGDVYPCTDTLNYKMGNILEEQISKIYNNDKYKKFRKDSISGENYECKNCLAWGPPEKEFKNRNK